MKKLFSVLLLTTVFYSSLYSQTQTNEELKSLIKASFQYFPKIKEVENMEVSAVEKLSLTKLNKYSDINFNSSYSYVMPKISFPINGKEIQFAPVNNFNSSLGTSFNLFDFGKLKTAVEKDKLDIQTAKHNTLNAKHNLAYQVAVIYYSILYFHKAIAIQDSIIHFYQENKRFVENKLKNGEALALDVINLQATIDQEENKKIDLLSSLEKQQSLLEYTTGLKYTSNDNFNFDFEYSDMLTNDSLIYTNNPLFLIADDNILSAKKGLDLVKHSNNPAIALHAASGIRNGYVPNVNEVRFNYLGGVSLSIPLYSFGKVKQQMKLQESMIKQFVLSKNSLINEHKKDVEESLIDIKYNSEKIKHNQNQINAALKAQSVTSSRYQNGIATYLDIISAANNVQKARLDQLQNQLKLCLSKIELAKLIGYNYWN